MLAGELYVFSTAFDHGCTIKNLLIQSVYSKLGRHHSFDSKSISCTIKKSKSLKKLPMVTEVSKARKSYKVQGL